MDFIAQYPSLHVWLLSYGSLALFFLLFLGILALPVPEETLLVFCGMLIKQGHLNLEKTFCAAILGSFCGITSSYLIGKYGIQLLMSAKLGKFRLKEKSLEKTKKWIDRFGPYALSIGYFIPGVRHFTGLLTGATKLKYRIFCLFAYSGGLLWVTLFLAIGYYIDQIKCLLF
ncbi:MAG: DedA family protein [Rhabdochlamydiaceae bacterium]